MAKLRLNYKKTFFIGFGFLASSIAWAMYNAFVPPMLENRFVPDLLNVMRGWHLTGGIADYLLGGSALTMITGFFMTIDNIFGVVFQPVFGALSDKTRTRMGRRTPYILVGLPISAVLFCLIPLAPSLSLFCFVLIVFNFVMSTWRAPVVALMPDLTPAPLRSTANGIINLMGGIGSMLAFVLGGLLSDIWPPAPFFFGSAIMLIALVLLRIFVKEPQAAQEAEAAEADSPVSGQEERRGRVRSLLFLLFGIFFWFNGYNAVETLFTLYATKVLGVTPGSASMMLAFFSVTFIAASVPAGLLSNRIGRRTTILIGLAGVTVLFPAIIMMQSAAVVRLLLLVGGMFWACVNINSLPMVLELCAHKDIGKYTGYYYLFSFSASITAPILAGLVRDRTSDYGSIFIYAGAAFAIALVCILFVRHGEARKDTAADILERMET